MEYGHCIYHLSSSDDTQRFDLGCAKGGRGAKGTISHWAFAAEDTERGRQHLHNDGDGLGEGSGVTGSLSPAPVYCVDVQYKAESSFI